MVSTLTGQVTDDIATPGYWCAQARRTVRFADAVHTAAQLGGTRFAEVGPGSALTVMTADCLSGLPATALVPARASEPQEVLTGLGELFTAGATVDWTALFDAVPATRVDLPTYAFQRQRYWLPIPAEENRDSATDAFWNAVAGQDLHFLTQVLNVAGDAPLSAVLPALSTWHENRRRQSIIDNWRYTLRWKRLPQIVARRSTRRWVVLTAGEALSAPVVAALSRSGAQVVELQVAPAGADLETELRGLADGTDGVLCLFGLDEHRMPSHPAVPAGFARTMEALRAWSRIGAPAPFWCLTRGAAAVSGADRVDHPAQALLWGLGPVAAQEYPLVWGGLVDLPADPDAAALDLLWPALTRGDGEDQLAIRADGISGRRLARAPHPMAGPAGRSWRPDGTVLITGGTGVLGAHLARWLADNGAPHLVLASRRGADAPGAGELEAELIERGATVTFARCDIADRDMLRELIAQHPPAAVFHTAAVLNDAPIETLTTDHLERALRVKAGGALNLHELTRHLDLTAFVLFSSAAGVLASAGQGNYSPGNAFLDALAEHRRALGLPATSVAWGAWAGGGLASVIPARSEMPGMQPALALDALHRCLDADETFTMIADIDWRRLAADLAVSRPLAVVEEIPEAAASASPADPATATLRRQLLDAPAPERRSVLTDTVRRHAAAILGHHGLDAVGHHQVFKDLGMDSVAGLHLINRLRADTGVRLPASAIYSHPTPAALAERLDAELVPDGAGDPVEAGIRQLEAALATVDADDLARSGAGTRLQAILSRLEPAPDGDEDADIQSATREEVLALLDKEFGED